MPAGTPDASFWKDKKVLVTGTTGFAGGHLAELLDAQGAEVRSFVRSPHGLVIHLGHRSKTILGDIQDYQSLLEALKGVDVAFHLAATTIIPETRAKVFNTFTTNALGTLYFLTAARERHVKKTVYVSTCHVYGKQDKLPIDEEQPPHPIDIYSASKLSGESLALSFAEMYNMDISISRAFNHYGPRQRQEFLIASIITRLLKKEPLEMGNPNPTRDFTYVDDIVRGYTLLAEKGRTSEVYHFASGKERTVGQITEEVVKASGMRPEVKWNPDARRVDIPRSWGDYSKARKELGWEPKVSFDDGLKRAFAWYRSELKQMPPVEAR